MNFFIKIDTLDTIIKGQDFNTDDIIFNNSDIWKIINTSCKKENDTLTDQITSARYIECSIFPVYDVLNSKSLNLIITDDHKYIIQNDSLYDIITSVNQKCHFITDYVYFARPEKDGYLIYIDRFFEPFSYKFRYFYVDNAQNYEQRILDNPDEIISYYMLREKVVEKNGTLYYLGSPWYVHQYLSDQDNEYFKQYQKAIKCHDLRLKTSTTNFVKKMDVRFAVTFDSSAEAKQFLEGFYARKFIGTI